MSRVQTAIGNELDRGTAVYTAKGSTSKRVEKQLSTMRSYYKEVLESRIHAHLLRRANLNFA